MCQPNVHGISKAHILGRELCPRTLNARDCHEQANPGGANVEVLDEQARDSTTVVDEAVRIFEKREVCSAPGTLAQCFKEDFLW